LKPCAPARAADFSMEAKKLIVPTALLSIGQFLPIFGIVGAWMLVGAVGRVAVPVAAMLTAAFVAPAVHLPSLELAVLLKIAVWAILLTAILKIRGIYAGLAYVANAYIEWGMKLLLVGAITYVIGIGALLLAAAFMLIAIGLLSLPARQ